MGTLLAACSRAGLADDEIVLEFLQVQSHGMTEVKNLADATVSGTITLTVRENPRIREVRFHLNDPEGERAPVHEDAEAPYALELDTTELSDGPHSLTAIAEVDRGRPLVSTSTFTVQNTTIPDGDAGEAPGEEPVEEPTEDPADDADDGTGATPGDEPVAEPLPNATLYVSQRGSDGNDGRTPETAFRTIQKAADVVQPGDTVYIRGGTYPLQVFFRRSGTADRPITWTSYPGEWVVLDGSAQPAYTSSHRVWVYGASHNHFLNFEVKNSPRQGIYLEGAHDNLFRNIVTHGNHGSGIQVRDGNYNRFEYVVAYDNYDYLTPDRPGEHADGIGFHSGHGNVIFGSIAYGNSDDGFDTWRSTNSLIDASVAHHNGRDSHGNGNGFKAGGNRDVVHTVVKNSIAYGNRSNGFDYNSGQNVTFLNNTSFDNGRYPFVAGPTTTLHNNIAVGSRANSLSTSTNRNNTWDLGIGDPRFVSTDASLAEFLSLRSDSPALGKGTDGSDLGALPYARTFADLVGPRQLNAVAPAGDGTLALR